MTDQKSSADKDAVPLAEQHSSEAVNIEKFASVVAGMNRFVFQLAKIPTFKETELNLAGWLVLMMVSQKGEVGGAQLARLLGSSDQRAGLITDSLVKAGLILNGESKAGERGRLSLTDSGKTRLAMINTSLQRSLGAALGDRARLLAPAAKVLSALTRAMAPEQPKMQSRKR